MDSENYAKKVEELLKLPQSLCKQCGCCCRLSIFKNGYTIEQMLDMLVNPNTDPQFLKGLKDFLSIFELITYEEALKINRKFTMDLLTHLKKTKDEISFFHCKYVTDDNKCSIHENRPDLCRQYPVCYRNMLYFDGCGYAEQAKKNWAEVEKILDKLGIKDI